MPLNKILITQNTIFCKGATQNTNFYYSKHFFMVTNVPLSKFLIPSRPTRCGKIKNLHKKKKTILHATQYTINKFISLKHIFFQRYFF